MLTSIFLSTSQDVVSRDIRFATRSKASHTGFGVRWAGIDMLIAATIHGVMPVTRAKFLTGNTIVEEYFVPEALVPTDAELAGDLAMPYDLGAIFGFPFVILARYFKHKARNPFANPHKVICSEWVAQKMAPRDGQGLWTTFPGSATEPEDVAQVCHRLAFPRAAP